MIAESIGARLGVEELDLILAEKDCVLTSSDDDVEDLSAFVTERLQSLSAGSVEKVIGDESVTVEGIPCGSVAAVEGPNVGSLGNVGTEEVDRGRTTSACPNVGHGGDVDADDRRFSPGEEVN